MKRFKRWFQKVLLYLLKMLNMPRTFSEFTKPYQNDIYNMVKPLFPSNPYEIIRIDNNGDYFVIEYKKRTSLETNPDYNNPDCSVNISKNFQIVISGFNELFETLIRTAITEYLIKHNFIEKQ